MRNLTQTNFRFRFRLSLSSKYCIIDDVSISGGASVSAKEGKGERGSEEMRR
jgi:hypothetical protein